MADYSVLYPKRFLDSHVLEAPRTIRIVSVVAEALEGDKGPKIKGVLKYKDAKGTGEIVWPITNSMLAAALFGAIDNGDPGQPVRDTDKWVGRLMTIYRDPDVRFGAEKVGGVRVYGSPDLTREITVSVQVTRKRRPQEVTLHPTGQGARKPAPSKPTPCDGAHPEPACGAACWLAGPEDMAG